MTSTPTPDVPTYDKEWGYVLTETVDGIDTVVCISSDVEDVRRCMREGNVVLRVPMNVPFDGLENARVFDVSLPEPPPRDMCMKLSHFDLTTGGGEDRVYDSLFDPIQFGVFVKTHAVEIGVPKVNRSDAQPVIRFLDGIRAQHCTHVDWSNDNRVMVSASKMMCGSMLLQELVIVQRRHSLYAHVQSGSMLNRCSADRNYIATTEERDAPSDGRYHIRPGVTWPFVCDVQRFVSSKEPRAVANVNILMDDAVNDVDEGHAAVLLFWRDKHGDVLAMMYDSYNMLGGNYGSRAYTVKHVLHRAGVKLLIPDIRGAPHGSKETLKIEKGYCGAWCLLMTYMFIRFPHLSPPLLAQILAVQLGDAYESLHAIRCYANKIMGEVSSHDMFKKLIKSIVTVKK
jgi:hypothetical protein